MSEIREVRALSDVSRAVSRLLIRLAVIAAVLMLLWFFGPTLWHLLSPFLLAIPVAAMLQKPIRWSEKKLHFKHGLSVTVWVALVCLAICALLYWLLSTVISQVIQLSGNYQAVITDLVNLLRGVSNEVLEALDHVPASVEEWIRVTLNDAFGSLSATATRWLGGVLNFALSFASGIPYGLIYLNFLLLGIFFITSDYGKIKSRLFASMGDSMRSRSEMLSGSAGQGLSGYVRVQFLFGLIVLVVSGPALSFFGLPYAFLIALIAAILEFLPIFGNGTLYIPVAIICYIIGNPTLGTELLILHLVLYIFRRITEPKLLSNHMGLSTLLSLVAMFVGMQMGGVLGLILAPVAVVVIQAAWHGGLFTATLTDLRYVMRHLSALLAGTPPEEEATAEEPPDAADPSDEEAPSE